MRKLALCVFVLVWCLLLCVDQHPARAARVALRRLDPNNADDVSLLPFLHALPQAPSGVSAGERNGLVFSEEELNDARRLLQASRGVLAGNTLVWFWGCTQGQNPAINTTVREEQCTALATFYCKIHYDFGFSHTYSLWPDADVWDDGVFCRDGDYYCGWPGVSCDPEGYVIELELPDHNLAYFDGVVPDGLGALTKLETINLGPTHKFPGFFSQEDLHKAGTDMRKDYENSNRFQRLAADWMSLSNLRQVYLGGLGLLEIMDAVFRNSSSTLVEIDLSGNPLRSISNVFTEEYPVLQTLDLSYCQLATFPDLNATALRNLSLTSNRLSSLSLSLGSLLPSVQQLMLSGNSLETVLLSSFVGLTKLQTLDLDSNKLTAIPTQLCAAATELRRLRVSGNRLTELPDVSLCSALTHLEANWNPLTSFPNSTLQSLSLRRLRLSGAGLAWAPAQILGGLPTLEELRMESNSIERFSPPETATVYSNLSILALGENLLVAVPRLVSPTLTQLFLDHNRLGDAFFAAQPDFFAGVPAMDVLVLSNNNLTVLPNSLLLLAKLRYLFADRNRIRSIPEDFGFAFPELCSLNLEDNHLAELPESFGNLSRMNRINLKSNLLRLLPESFGYHGSDVGFSCSLFGSEVGMMRQVLLSNNLLTELPSSFSGFFLHNIDMAGFPLGLIDLSHNVINPLPSFDHASKFFMLRGHKMYVAQLVVILDSMNLTALPSDFGLESTFVQISLADNGLTSLPDSLLAAVKQSETLSGMDLSGNQLSDLSSLEFHSMSFLSQVALNENCLTDSGMPAFIPREWLYSISASENKLERMPNIFGVFNALTGDHYGGLLIMLDVHGNRIARLPFPVFSQITYGLATEGSMPRFTYQPPQRFVTWSSANLELDLSSNPLEGGVRLEGGYESIDVKSTNASRLWFPMRILRYDFGDNEQLKRWPEECYRSSILSQSFYKVHMVRASGSEIRGTLDEFFCTTPKDFAKMEILGVEGMPNLEGALPSCLGEMRSLYSIRAENNGPKFTADIAANNVARETVQLQQGASTRLGPGSREKQQPQTSSDVFAARAVSVAGTVGGTAGDLLGPVQFGPELVGDMYLQASCPNLLVEGVPNAVIEVEPSYYGRSACVCDKLYYGDATTGLPCEPCAGDEVICPVSGLLHPLPAPGFWAIAEPPFRAQHCRANDAGGRTACSNVALDGPLGHFESSAQFYERMRDVVANKGAVAQWCDEGYEGTLCSRCEDGYFQSGGNRCVKCPRGAGGLAFLYVILLLTVFFALVGLGYAASSSWTREWRLKRALGATVRAREKLRIGTVRRLPSTTLGVGRELREVESMVLEGEAGAGSEDAGSDDEDGARRPAGSSSRRVRAEFLTASAPEHVHEHAEAAVVKELRRRRRRPFIQRKQLLGVSTLVFHFQMVNLLSKVGTGLFSISLLSGEGLACFNFQLGSPECYFPGWGFFETFLTAILVPVWQTCLVFPIVGIAFVMYIWGQAHRYAVVTAIKVAWRRRVDWVERAREIGFGVPRAFVFFLRRTAFILLFLYFQSYMSVTPLVLQALRCSRISEGSGTFRYLMAAPYFKCDASDGKYVAMVVLASLYFVFWVVGLPVIFFFGTMFELKEFEFLFRIYRTPRVSRVERTMEIGRLVRHQFAPSFDASGKTHLMQSLYKYWEVWKILLRVLVSMVVAFVDVDSAFVPFLLILLFAVAAVLQSTFRPLVQRYDSSTSPDTGRKSYANELEFSSFMLIITNFTCALIAKMPHTSNVTVLGILLVVFNIVFLLLGVGVILRSPIFSATIFAPPKALLRLLRIFLPVAGRFLSSVSEKKSLAEGTSSDDDGSVLELDDASELGSVEEVANDQASATLLQPAEVVQIT